ncbi:MAG TPA: DNA-3-methyladenine glycosylase 2 family protein [Stellaceae bacterium]|nr:DNA-3-methyladenine glycosylase 2 family protein [Stellaceae bacterium]
MKAIRISSAAPSDGAALALPDDEEEARALLARARRRLMRRDPRLAAVIKLLGPCVWNRRPGGFAILFHAILRQQLSGKAAATIAARLLAACGGTITPEAVAALDDAAFASAGVSRQKRDYLRGLAAAALTAPRLFAELELLPDEAAIEALTAVKGIGRWTAEMYLMFSLGRLDVLPLGDVSIRAAIADIYDVRRDAPAARLLRLAEPWRPFRSVACWYFYAHLDRARRAEQAS